MLVDVIYEKPTKIEEVSRLKEEGGILFSGGTDVFVKIRKGVVSPRMLIDTKGIETPKIECDEKEIRIYMNTTYTDVLRSKCISNFPILESIIKKVGSKQIRNRGTPVGNIGNASPAGDFLLATYLLDGEVIIAPDMKRVPVKDLVKGPGKVELSKGEFIYGVALKKFEGYKSYFEKVGRRNALVIAIASIGVLVKTNENNIEDIRIAYGSLGPTIVRFEDLESEMKGRKFSLETFKEFASKYMERIKPISDVRASKEYRKLLSKNLLIKAFHVLSKRL